MISLDGFSGLQARVEIPNWEIKIKSKSKVGIRWAGLWQEYHKVLACPESEGGFIVRGCNACREVAMRLR